MSEREPYDARDDAVRRLDVALAERGLARSRSHARQLIDAGRVTVDGRAAKANTKVFSSTVVGVTSDRYVSRGAQKLLRALDQFKIDLAGRRALDVGASTGGFTQVLLERGAAHVTALDVGHGQFALAEDPRIRVLEGMNVRDIRPGDLDDGIDFVVADVSFISASFLFEPITAALADVSDWMVLVKPQFEVGRERIGDGVVHDAGLRRSSVERVALAAADHGWQLSALARSPIEGTHGNIEYLAHFVANRDSNELGSPQTPLLPTEWDELFEETGGERG